VVGSTVPRSVTIHYNSYDFTEAESIKNFLTNLQNKQALFLNRNPRVGLRKPEGRRINRFCSFISNAMKKYFKKSSVA
jgi:hypothetical protein